MLRTAERPLRSLFGHVVVSGYWDPLHPGHLAYMRAAWEMGSSLTVIVNSDRQAVLKKGKPNLPEDVRMAVIRDCFWADRFALSIDEDMSVCRTLEAIHKEDPVDIFANGGDVSGTCREQETCERLGIRLVFGVGGGKIASSSELAAGWGRQPLR